MKINSPLIHTAIAVLVLAALTGCSKTTSDISDNYKMPEGMSDCRIYQLSAPAHRELYVIKCGDVVTSVTSSGKVPVTVAVPVTK